MLKIYTLEASRRDYLLSLAPQVPKGKKDKKKFREEKGLSMWEWRVLTGYLCSRDWKKGTNQLRRKEKKLKTEKHLCNMSYAEYLKTDHWKRIKKRTRKRDKTCRVCNSIKRLQVHHRVYDNRGCYRKEINDVILLCEECHKKAHL